MTNNHDAVADKMECGCGIGAEHCVVQITCEGVTWSLMATVQLAHKQYTGWFVEITSEPREDWLKWKLKDIYELLISLPGSDSRLKIEGCHVIQVMNSFTDSPSRVIMVAPKLKWISPVFEVPIDEMRKVARTLLVAPQAVKRLEVRDEKEAEPTWEEKIKSFELELQSFIPSGSIKQID